LEALDERNEGGKFSALIIPTNALHPFAKGSSCLAKLWQLSSPQHDALYRYTLEPLAESNLF